MIHYDIHRFACVSILHPSTSNEGYAVNTFYIASKEGELLETHSSLGRAQHWAKQSADFLSEAGLQGPHRRVYQLMAGVGFILKGEF